MQRFTILTPPADYDPRRAFAGLMIQEWLRDMGMPVFARPMSFSALLQQVKGKRCGMYGNYLAETQTRGERRRRRQRRDGRERRAQSLSGSGVDVRFSHNMFCKKEL